MEKSGKLVIVGGVAGGASCAARARRMSETASILVFERGPHVSFANCGLPYYVGGIIKQEDDLLMATPEYFQERFNVEVRTLSTVEAVYPDKKEIRVKNLATGETYSESYDTLVLAPGASPLKPPLPGIDLAGLFTVRNIPDTHAILRRVQQTGATGAAIVGGGYIGLEMTESLAHRGLSVTLIEREEELLPLLDPEMAAPIRSHLRSRGVEVVTGSSVSGFEADSAGGVVVRLENGNTVSADLAILAMGVKPEIALAKDAGLAIGDSGGIAVDGQMRTSDPDIFAVGDAVEVASPVTGLKRLVPLAGPANRQGRMAADVIFDSRPRTPSFPGVLGTSVCGVFGLTAAVTGETEKSLAAAAEKGVAIDYEAIYCEAYNHSTYYPGAKPLRLKILFEKETGRILGAQGIGTEGVEKRIDVIATTMRYNGTVFDLEDAELCYAPQYGAAKDPVNIAGMIAANHLRGHMGTARWENLDDTEAMILDVRTQGEWRRGHVKGALHIPIDSLRDEMHKLPRDRELWIYCAVGQRSYLANRILDQNGYATKNLVGGISLFETAGGATVKE